MVAALLTLGAMLPGMTAHAAAWTSMGPCGLELGSGYEKGRYEIHVTLPCSPLSEDPNTFLATLDGPHQFHRVLFGPKVVEYDYKTNQDTILFKGWIYPSYPGTYVLKVTVTRPGRAPFVETESTDIPPMPGWTPPSTARPTSRPTPVPVVRPTTRPTARPTARPTVRPTAQPTPRPTASPTAQPTPVPVAAATLVPSRPSVSRAPIVDPTDSPSAAPAAASPSMAIATGSADAPVPMASPAAIAAFRTGSRPDAGTGSAAHSEPDRIVVTAGAILLLAALVVWRLRRAA